SAHQWIGDIRHALNRSRTALQESASRPIAVLERAVQDGASNVGRDRTVPHLVDRRPQQVSNWPFEPARATQKGLALLTGPRHFEPSERLGTEQAFLVPHALPSDADAPEYLVVHAGRRMKVFMLLHRGASHRRDRSINTLLRYLHKCCAYLTKIR